MRVEDRQDGGVIVQPAEKALQGGAFGDADVELFAKLDWEFCDFFRCVRTWEEDVFSSWFLVLGSWFFVVRSSVVDGTAPGICFSLTAFQFFSFSVFS